MATPVKAIYVVNIDGEQYRRPAENPYVSMSKIKKDIKTHFELDYDFDLTYKGSKISETSSLAENCFDDCTPLVVLRKDTKYTSNGCSKEEYRKPLRSSYLPRRTSRTTAIHKVLSLNNLSEEEDIEDETESNAKTSTVSDVGYHWKPRTKIIYISSARPVDDEEISLSLQASINSPLSSRVKLPSLMEPIDQTIEQHPHALLSPPFSTEVQPMYSADQSMPTTNLRIVGRRSLSSARQQTTVKLSVQRNTSLTKTNMKDRVDSMENLSSTANNRLPDDSPNATSGYNSSSSSRSSSPSLSNFHLIVPTLNRDLSKPKGTSSQITVNIQTLNDMYTRYLPINATLKQLYRMLKEQLEHHQQLEKYTHRTHTLLFFNSRMHIFKNIDIDNERIDTFLSLKTNHHKGNDRSPDFFAYALTRKLSDNMYIYEQVPSKIFANSIWWQSHSDVEQTTLAQSTILSTLYVLYQYFRRPPLNEKASRRALEIQFLLYLRKYCFPPAFQALKHILIREIFAFEKAVLMDGLLKLLSQFCPSSVERNLLGIYTPHLFCWLFERSRDEMETQDGFLLFNLMRYSNNISPHYINDPITIHDLDHDRSILYEYHEAERYRNVTRNVDLFSLIKHLKNPPNNEIYDLETYSIDMWGCHELQSIDRLSREQMSDLEKIMARVYQSFTILIRNALENSDIRDQLILINNKQVGICFKRQQRMKSDGKLDQDLRCFMPAHPDHLDLVTLNTSDVFEVEDGRPDPQIPSPIRSNLPMKSKPIECYLPVEQITIILLDISDSMFTKRSDNHTVSKRFIDISINMLTMISKNLQRQSRSHAIGIILFGKHVLTHCPITTNAEEFEQAIYRIPKHGQPWTSMYDAINTGFDSIHQYESRHKTTSDCEKLIICITDGINNRGTLTIDHLKQKVRRTPVVIDLIFFSTNVFTLYTPQERNSIRTLRLLCEQSGGIIYRNSSIESVDLATTFDQEAVLWLKARQQRKSYGRGVALSVDWPLAREPDKLRQSAVRVRTPQKTANDSQRQTDFFQRLHAEVNGVVRKQINNIELYICRGHDGQLDYTFWKVILQGPSDSLYANGRWLLYIIFSADYPILPPTIRFHTPIFHLNISGDGQISHDLFDIGWSTVVSMTEIFRTLNKLLVEPDIHSAVSEEYVQLYEKNRRAYESRVYKSREKHAKEKLDKFKRFYHLEDA